jgi:hypothetical protein
MPKRTSGGSGRARGRPKGSGPGRMTGRIALRVSPEYRVWLSEFATRVQQSDADIVREGIRLYAESKRFRPPPAK